MHVASALLFLGSIATSCFATVIQIDTDIKTITNSLHTLETSLYTFPTPGGTLAEALAILKEIEKLGTVLDQGTADINATVPPIPSEDCDYILTSIGGMEPSIDDILTRIVALKSAFQALPIGGIPALVKQHIIILCDSLEAFLNAMITLCPSDEGSSLRNRIRAACDAAEAAYANV